MDRYDIDESGCGLTTLAAAEIAKRDAEIERLREQLAEREAEEEE